MCFCRVIYTEDVERIFGKRKWVSRTEEILEEAKAKEAENTESDKDDNPAKPEIEQPGADLANA